MKKFYERNLPTANAALPKRYSRKQLREKIIEICTDWVTVEQIAEQIGRNVKYVKNHVIPIMTDLLEKMYDVPHHPRQRYRNKSI